MAYTENCGNITEISGYWNLALHFNVENYYHDVDQLHESLNHLEKICRTEISNSICTRVLMHFEQKLQIITANERIIKNKMSIHEKRAAGMLNLGSVIGATGTMLYNWIFNSQNTEYQTEF